MKEALIVCLILFGIEFGFNPTEVLGHTDKSVQLSDFSNNGSVNIRVKENWAYQSITLISEFHGHLDSLTISNAQEIDTLLVTKERFLIIRYRCRGGSGEHLRYSKIFTVKMGRLFESISILTLHQSFSSDGRLQRNYKVLLKVNKEDNNYKVDLKEEERRFNYVFLKRFSFTFDNENMAFYSKVIDQKNRSLCIESKLVKCNEDAVYNLNLNKEAYIFYRKCWYQQDLKGCFYKI